MIRIDRYLVEEHVASHLFQVGCAEADALALLVDVCDEAAHALVLLKHVLQQSWHLLLMHCQKRQHPSLAEAPALPVDIGDEAAHALILLEYILQTS